MYEFMGVPWGDYLLMDSSVKPLSKQQWTLAQLIHKEFTSRQIAEIMGLKESTVKTYTYELAKELAVQGRVGIAVFTERTIQAVKQSIRERESG